MEKFRIKGPFIHLNQLLKAVGWCDNGADASAAIGSGQVKVNGHVELRKRNKITPGNSIAYKNQEVIIE
jgi:ribosome-associated protein